MKKVQLSIKIKQNALRANNLLTSNTVFFSLNKFVFKLFMKLYVFITTQSFYLKIFCKTFRNISS